MTDQIRISAKNLGELALGSFCPRCFWIKLHVGNKLPFQIFPGIFSSIDSYTKKMAHAWFDGHGTAPDWLTGLGSMKGYINPPHFSKFFLVDGESRILLSGTPDDIFVRDDNSHIIVDYKTAKYTGSQDSLYPMYETQLNVYALIGEQRGLHPVSDLALIYMEPVTDNDACCEEKNHRENGFAMGFAANIHKVALKPEMVQPLLMKTREIFEMEIPPECGRFCENCERVETLVESVVNGIERWQ